MSKGSKIVPIRFPETLRIQILTEIERASDRRFLGTLSFGEWIRIAAKEKLDHMRRSRRSRRKKEPV